MADLQKIVLTGARVILRDAKSSDVADRFALGTSKEIQRMFGADPSQQRELTEGAAAAWVEQISSQHHGWVIEYAGRAIGAIRLHSLNPVDKRAHLAIGLLDESVLGQGLGSEAMRLLASHAFSALDLNRLSVRVLDFNARAIAAYEKVGFQLEGRERQSAFIGGTWYDDVMMGLLRDDFQALDAA